MSAPQISKNKEKQEVIQDSGFQEDLTTKPNAATDVNTVNSNNSEIKSADVSKLRASTLSLTLNERAPSNWDIQADPEDSTQCIATYLTYVFRGTPKEFSAMLRGDDE